MEQIPDAPWIREAERDGFPPYETVDYEQALKCLKKAWRELDDASDYLFAAEDLLNGTGGDLRDMRAAVEDVASDVRSKIRALEED